MGKAVKDSRPKGGTTRHCDLGCSDQTVAGPDRSRMLTGRWLIVTLSSATIMGLQRWSDADSADRPNVLLGQAAQPAVVCVCQLRRFREPSSSARGRNRAKQALCVHPGCETRLPPRVDLIQCLPLIVAPC